MKKRLFSTALALTMLMSGMVSVRAEEVQLFNNDFNNEANLWTDSSCTRELKSENDENNYLSITGSFKEQVVLVQVANVPGLTHSEDNYTVFQFNTKISENQTGIRFYRSYKIDGAQTNEVTIVDIEEDLRGVSEDSEWVDVKIVYGDEGYTTYVNDVPKKYTESATVANRFSEYNSHTFRFLARNAAKAPDTSTVYIDNLTIYDVPKTDVFNLSVTGEDKIRIPNKNETEATEVQFEAVASDYMNNAIFDIVWSLDKDYEGVSIDENGKLTVENTALSCVISVKATAGGKTVSKEISLIKEDISSVTVSGDSNITLKNKYETGTVKRQYSATCFDFTDAEVQADVQWCIENATDGIAIDENGSVTLADDVEPGTFDVVATAEDKKGKLTVTIEEALIDFKKENELINVHINNQEAGVKTPNTAIMGNVYGLDTSTSANITGYVSPFEIVQESEEDKCLKMTYPALTEQGSYGIHAAYFNQKVTQIDSDIFILSMNFKYSTEGTDALRCEIFPGSGSQVNIHLSNTINANLGYKNNVGKWHEVKAVFNRNTLSCNVYVDNYLTEKKTVSENFWTTGIKQLRAIHCTREANKVPVDNKVYELYLDDYRVYVPEGVTLEGIYATGMDGSTERNILNLKTGFDSWSVGSSPSLSGEELSVKLTYLNNSKNAVNVNAVLGVYKNGALVAVSGVEKFEIGAEAVSEGNVVKITLPALGEGETFEGYTLKAFAWYEDGTPFDYAYVMTNDRWNFQE